MRDDVIYNKFDNEVMVKTAGEYIYIICIRKGYFSIVFKNFSAAIKN